MLDELNVCHSLVMLDVDTKEMVSCADQPGYTSIKDGLEILGNAELLIGHNIQVAIAILVEEVGRVACLRHWLEDGHVEDACDHLLKLIEDELGRGVLLVLLHTAIITASSVEWGAWRRSGGMETRGQERQKGDERAREGTRQGYT